MAYSTNPVTVRRMQSFLEPLVAREPVTYRVEPGRARWFAYKLREALRLAQEFPEEFPELEGLEFRFTVCSSREVLAKPRERPEEVLIEAEPVAVPTLPSTVAQQEAGLEEIVEQWQRQPVPGKLYFPRADLPPEELTRLWEWAQLEGVLLMENAGALTLVPLEGHEDVADYAWDPSELEGE